MVIHGIPQPSPADTLHTVWTTSKILSVNTNRTQLLRYAWLSIAAAVATITLKAAAWVYTGSVGLLADAAESLVNLVAAVVALIALKVAAKPADQTFSFGRAKAEYFSAAVEGLMIFAAAGWILITSVERFLNPQPLDNLGLGLVISMVAAVLNGVIGLVLIHTGKQHRSATLVADGKHLMTDVVTSVGVLVGVGLVMLTGWERLDPILGFAVGLNIIYVGIGLVSEAAQGLLDRTLPDEENERIIEILRRNTTGETRFHGLRTRAAGHLRHASVHVLVPGDWTVQRGHAFTHDIETQLQHALPGIEVVTHLEPVEDPESYSDMPEGQLPIDDGLDLPPGADTN